MKHRAILTAMTGLALAVGLYLSLPTDRPASTPEAPSPPPVQPVPNQDSNAQTLTAHPTVTAYLSREADKQRLRDYFAGRVDEDPDAIWAMIESLEQQQRVLGFEALHLKLAWLEKQHSKREEFEAAAQALMEDYRQRAAASGDSYRPENIPGYTDYKTRELEIIARVNQMQSFPDGLSRAEYLRRQLLEARLQAYGETN